MSTTPVSNTTLAKRLLVGAWSLSALVSVVAIIAWGQDYQWKLTPLSAYQLFPLLGILAFSIMWSHYVAGIVREFLGVKKQGLKNYFEYTSYAVLALILLHPGLLILQRFRDGYGLPPGSYESYVAPGLGWVTILGSISLVVFLAYEFRRVFGDRSWWHFVKEAGDIAMLAILYHGLRLGGQLMDGWFRTVWVFYGLILIAILGYYYITRYFLKKS